MKIRPISFKVKAISNVDGKNSLMDYLRYVLRIGSFSDLHGKKRDPVLFACSGNIPGCASGSLDEMSSNEARVAYPFWKALALAERKNGQLCKSIVIGLPVELSFDRQIILAKEYASKITAVEGGGGLPWCFVIHAGGGINPHVHMLISNRINDGVERPARRWFARASNGKSDSAAGGARKHAAWSSRALVFFLREVWEFACNTALERSGSTTRVRRESNIALDIDQVPKIRVGKGRNTEYKRNYNAIVELFNYSNGCVRRWVAAAFVHPGGIESLGESEFNQLLESSKGAERESPKSVLDDAIASEAMFEREILRAGCCSVSADKVKEASRSFSRRRAEDLGRMQGKTAMEQLNIQVKFFRKSRAGPRRLDFARLNLPKSGVHRDYLLYILECLRDVEVRAREACRKKMQAINKAADAKCDIWVQDNAREDDRAEDFLDLEDGSDFDRFRQRG